MSLLHYIISPYWGFSLILYDFISSRRLNATPCLLFLCQSLNSPWFDSQLTVFLYFFLKENCIGECFFTPFCGLWSRILLYFHMCVCHDVSSVTSQLLNHLMISTIKNIYFLKAYHLGNFCSSPWCHMIWWSSWSGPHFQLMTFLTITFTHFLKYIICHHSKRSVLILTKLANFTILLIKKESKCRISITYLV